MVMVSSFSFFFFPLFFFYFCNLKKEIKKNICFCTICLCHEKNTQIAFMLLFSDKQKVYEAPVTYSDKTLDLKNILNLSMACSDSKIYTTWSNLKHSSINKAMTRHPSGNNNTIPNFLQGTGNILLGNAKRSQSLPDLSRAHELQQANVPLNFSVSCNFFLPFQFPSHVSKEEN